MINELDAVTSRVTVFYSYAHADEELRNQLEKHLSLLRQQGIIAEWHDHQIVPGADWAHEINIYLTTAAIILLLISPDFLSSDYCYSIEMRRALDRHETGEARVLPILLRPVYYEGAPFEKLKVLPSNGKPITSWLNSDEAFAEVAREISKTVKELLPGLASIVSKRSTDTVAVEALHNQLRTSEQARERLICIQALGENGSLVAIEALQEWLGTTKFLDERQACIQALSHSDSTIAAEVLRGQLRTSEQARERLICIQALGENGSLVAIEALQEWLGTTKFLDERQACIQALSHNVTKNG